MAARRNTSTTLPRAPDGSVPHDASGRWAYWRWNLFLLGLLVLTTASFGSGLDRLDPLPAGALFVALTLSSLLGVGLTGVVVLPWFIGWLERLGLVVLLYVAWRVAYFPVFQLSLVGSGLVAEGLLGWTRFSPWTYPTLLPLVSILHALAGLLAVWPWMARRLSWVALTWPPLALAALISFCGWQDAHLLPDRGYALDPRAAGQGAPDLPSPDQPAPALPATGPNATGPNAAGPNGTGPNGTGPNGTGPNGTGPNGAGADGIGPPGTAEPGSLSARPQESTGRSHSPPPALGTVSARAAKPGWPPARLRLELQTLCYRLRGSAPWSDVVQSRLYDQLVADMRFPDRGGLKSGPGAAAAWSTARHLGACYAACLAAQELVGQRRLTVSRDPEPPDQGQDVVQLVRPKPSC